jgi:transcriptional regulator with XRE-family HTH domain
MTTSRYQQIMKTFAKRLRKTREAKGYQSAQAFAQALGVEPHGYRKYERGQSEPNFEMLLRICELLETHPTALLPPRNWETMGHNSGGQSAAA